MEQAGTRDLMAANVPNTAPFDFSGLKEVSRDSLEAKLYQIIDDIDTASDMYKPDIGGYEKYVFKKIHEAHKYITSDGYKLYYLEQPVVERQNMKFTYTGELKPELDEKIILFAEKQGFEFIGSGYNFKTKTRDICFESEVG